MSKLVKRRLLIEKDEHRYRVYDYNKLIIEDYFYSHFLTLTPIMENAEFAPKKNLLARYGRKTN